MKFTKKEQRDIIRMYTKEKMSMRYIAIVMGTNHKRISRFLHNNGIETVEKRTRTPYGGSAVAHRMAQLKRDLEIDGITREGRHGTVKLLRRKYNLSMEYIKNHDIGKLSVLNIMFSNVRIKHDLGRESFMQFVNHFHDDYNFDKFYREYISFGKKPYMMPRAALVILPEEGGKYEFKNIVIMPDFVVERRKYMTLQEWEEVKRIYFEDYEEDHNILNLIQGNKAESK